MKHAYDEMYLEDAMENMGEMVDYAVNVYHMDINEFWEFFLSPGCVLLCLIQLKNTIRLQRQV